MTKTTDSETEANRQTMIETFEAWRDGAEPFPDTWATDMVWRIEGHSIASREYAGKREISKSSSNPSARASWPPSGFVRPTSAQSTPTGTQ